MEETWSKKPHIPEILVSEKDDLNLDLNFDYPWLSSHYRMELFVQNLIFRSLFSCLLVNSGSKKKNIAEKSVLI